MKPTPGKQNRAAKLTVGDLSTVPSVFETSPEKVSPSPSPIKAQNVQMKDASVSKKFPLRDYYAMLTRLWSEELDPEVKGEISEQRFFKFLREHRICQERQQIDDLYKQMLILKKGQQAPPRGPISKEWFFRLFEKPLMMIPFETALCMIDEDNPPQTQKENAFLREENSKSTVAQTLAVIEFQRKYMKQVFPVDRTFQPLRADQTATAGQQKDGL